MDTLKHRWIYDAEPRRAKWRYRLFRVLELTEQDGLTLDQILAHPRIVRTTASESWLRQRLTELETEGLVWWNPSDAKYRLT